MIQRIQLSLLCSLVLLAIGAASSSASTILGENGGRTQSLTTPGIVSTEVGGGAKYIWVSDGAGAEGFLRGYDFDQGIPGLIKSIDADVGDPTGILGQPIVGVAMVPALSANPAKLVIVENDASPRVIVYDRIGDPGPTDPPVDYSSGVAYSDISGIPIDDPQGLAVNPITGDAYLTIYPGTPGSGGILRFDPITGGLISFPSGFSGGEPGAIAVDRNTGNLFVAIEGNGTIQALNPSGSDGVGIPIMDSGTPGDFTSISVEPESERLFAMKDNELDVFSTSTGTLLGQVTGIAMGGNLSVSAREFSQDVLLESSGTTNLLQNLIAGPVPVCVPDAPITVHPGQELTFTPICTDADGSTLQEFRVTNSQSRGLATPTSGLSAIKYTAGNSPGADDVAFRVQTQNGLSIEKHQSINIPNPNPPAQVPAEKPVIRETTNLQLDSGDVFVKLPGSNEFVKLTKDMLVPIGTVIDAREGKAHLTLANKDGSLYDGIFWDGIFQVIQGSGNNPVTTMKLRDDLVAKASGFATARTSAELERSFFAYTAKKRGKKKNGLWGDGKGKFKTSGKGGSAAVRGTRWYVANYANGSLFKVSRGSVTIDPIRGKNFKLKAGKSFFIFFKP